MTLLKLHFTRNETNQYDKLQAYTITKGFSNLLKSYAQQLHTNNILITEQYGIRKGIPTENATFSLTDCLKIY